MEPLILKYLPKKTSDVVGQNAAIRGILTFLNNYRKGQYCLIQGPVGSGKTSSVYAIAEELGMEVYEINASDHRNKDKIEELLNSATKQGSLFGKKRLVLVDEVDGLSGTKDRGGLPTLIKLARESPTPILMTLQDATDRKYNSLRKYSTLATFLPLSMESVQTKLKHICETEKLDYEEEALRVLASKCSGDMRIAINDLQVLSSTGINRQDALELTGRNREVNIKEALIRVLKTTKAEVSLGSFDEVSEDLNSLFSWIEYNLPAEYKKIEDLAKAYDAVSKADVFNGRIRRWQYYRFYVYCYALLTAGISISKKEKYPGMPNIKESSRGLMIWMNKNKLTRKLSIADKIAENTHTSSRVAFKILNELMPAIKRNPAIIDDLTKEELEWIKTKA